MTNAQGVLDGAAWEFSRGAVTWLHETPKPLEEASAESGGIFGQVIDLRSMFFLGLQNVDPNSLKMGEAEDTIKCRLFNGVSLTGKQSYYPDKSSSSITWDAGDTPLEYRFRFSSEKLSYSAYSVPQSIQRQVFLQGKMVVEDVVSVESLGPVPAEGLGPKQVAGASHLEFAFNKGQYFRKKGTNLIALAEPPHPRNARIARLITCLALAASIATLFLVLWARKKENTNKQQNAI